MIARMLLPLVLLAVPVAAEEQVDIDWRKVATEQDRARLRSWRQAWVDATAQVRRKGGALPAGTLFDYDRALPGAALAPGRYRCRTVKLGGMDVAANPVGQGSVVPCAVERRHGGTMLFIDGMQRAEGYLFEDNDARQVFLGTLALGDESRAMRYGRDRRRDMAGLVERIGERRWRLVLPYPGFESTLDVVDIVPARD